jgi:hypothetical protein
MEKTIFVFQRHKDRSKADFAQHYIECHAPLGARLTRVLLGYTVNIVNESTGPDAITEHWMPKAEELLTPDRAYATREDFEAVVKDDRTLFSSNALYVAVRETQPIPGDAPLVEPGQPTPQTKLIWLYADAATAPPPPAWALRVLDNHIGYQLVSTDTGRKQVESPYQLIRMAWAPLGAVLDSVPSGAICVTEYTFIRAPEW